jgi:hypothetical protein
MISTPLSTTRIRPVRWLWENRLPLGALSLLGGWIRPVLAGKHTGSGRPPSPEYEVNPLGLTARPPADPDKPYDAPGVLVWLGRMPPRAPALPVAVQAEAAA